MMAELIFYLKHHSRRSEFNPGSLPRNMNAPTTELQGIRLILQESQSVLSSRPQLKGRRIKRMRLLVLASVNEKLIVVSANKSGLGSG